MVFKHEHAHDGCPQVLLINNKDPARVGLLHERLEPLLHLRLAVDLCVSFAACLAVCFAVCRALGHQEVLYLSDGLRIALTAPALYFDTAFQYHQHDARQQREEELSRHVMVVHLAQEVHGVVQELVVELIGEADELRFQPVEAVVVRVVALQESFPQQFLRQFDKEISGHLVATVVVHQHALLMAQSVGKGFERRIFLGRQQTFYPVAGTGHLAAHVVEVRLQQTLRHSRDGVTIRYLILHSTSLQRFHQILCQIL